MKKRFTLMAAAAAFCLGASAQQTVQQYLRVSDTNFDVAHVQNADNPNSSNAVQNSFTINCEFGSVRWWFGSQYFWEQGVDWSKYDKLVVRLASVEGNNLQLRIFDYGSLNGQGGNEYLMPDDIVEMDEEVEYMIDLREDLEYQNGTGLVDKTNIKELVFWNYWDVHNDADGDGFPDYDIPQAEVTVTISAMYLERTLANGEKDYVDLLAEKPLLFSDNYLEADSSYLDNAGVMHLNENAYAGIYYDAAPGDWSQYRYVVVVPQVPFSDPMPTVCYVLTDYNDNAFDGGTFRHGFYNRARAAVLDLTAVTEQAMDGDVYLEEFDPSRIYSLEWKLWGGVQSIEYGLAAVYLSNTPPTYSNGFSDATDNVGDFIVDNAAENTITTICLPFAGAVCGAQVYEMAGVDSRTNPTEIYAKPHMGILEAGKPYIIRSNSSRNITVFRAGANEVSAPVDNGALKANSFPTYYVQQDQNYLVLNADGDTFEAVTERARRVNSNTAYVDFSLLEETQDPGDGLVFSVTGVDTGLIADGIKAVNASQATTADNAFYTLSGLRISKPATKGIYIHNGKKVVVK